ncbi:MAG: alpha/beta hydrolase domain-containing protein [Dehalococcoidia bacterium]
MTGPIVGGRRGWPFGGPVLPLAELGYREDEYFIEGEATRYDLVAGAEYSRDGRWQAEPVGTAPYKTRIVVYRPIDPARFNGMVVVHWGNVTVGFDLITLGAPEWHELIESGAALVAVTPQRAGIEGLPPSPQGLAAWDPERYGTLSIPGDDYSFDIFAQAAAAVGRHRSRTIDPMAGLDVSSVIANGASQSASRLATYLNALQPLTNAFDGYFLPLHFGNASPLNVGEAVANLGAVTVATFEAVMGRYMLRDDLDVPIMVVNTEFEAKYCYSIRQPDGDRYRHWECAGAAHSSLPIARSRRPLFARDGVGTELPEDGVNEVNTLPVFAAALRHMLHWIREGVPPPAHPRIAFRGDPPAIARDRHGIAQGGIRLPDVEIPRATNSATPVSDDVWALLRGSCHPFSREQLLEMYGDREGYLARFEVAAMGAVDAGVLLPRDVPRLVEEAAAGWPAE